METRQRATRSNAQNYSPVSAGNTAASIGVPRAPSFWRRLKHSVPFILVAGAVGLYVELHDVWWDTRANWSFIYASFFLMLVIFAIFLYITFYVPFKFGRKVDLTKWEETAPKPIQLATACACVSGIGLVIGLWPVYGLWSALIVFTEFLGFLALVTLF